MARERFADMHCSVARTASAIADPWTLLILRDMFIGLSRYEELRQDLSIATNVLADRLDRLVTDGLVEQHAYQRHPIRHEYKLTEAGRDLYGVVLAMMAWGDRHRATAGPPLRVVHHGCGQPTEPQVTCAHCGERLTTTGTGFQGGPGGTTAPGTALIATRIAAPESDRRRR